jgi:hypothetical protein
MSDVDYKTSDEEEEPLKSTEKSEKIDSETGFGVTEVENSPKKSSPREPKKVNH